MFDTPQKLHLSQCQEQSSHHRSSYVLRTSELLLQALPTTAHATNYVYFLTVMASCLPLQISEQSRDISQTPDEGKGSAGWWVKNELWELPEHGCENKSDILFPYPWEQEHISCRGHKNLNSGDIKRPIWCGFSVTLELLQPVDNFHVSDSEGYPCSIVMFKTYR